MNNGPEHHPARELVLYTGEGGMKEFERALWLRNLEDLLDWFVETSKIAKEQATNLHQMLTSNDSESITLAEELILIKLLNNGTNL